MTAGVVIAFLCLLLALAIVLVADGRERLRRALQEDHRG